MSVCALPASDRSSDRSCCRIGDTEFSPSSWKYQWRKSSRCRGTRPAGARGSICVPDSSGSRCAGGNSNSMYVKMCTCPRETLSDGSSLPLPRFHPGAGSPQRPAPALPLPWLLVSSVPSPFQSRVPASLLSAQATPGVSAAVLTGWKSDLMSVSLCWDSKPTRFGHLQFWKDASFGNGVDGLFQKPFCFFLNVTFQR